jgi:hypothetical protein
MKKKSRILIAILLALCLLGLAAISVTAAAGYAIPWSVFGGGMQKVSAGAYTLQGTVGQPVTGVTLSGQNRVDSGYWATVWSVFRSLLPVIIK